MRHDPESGAGPARAARELFDAVVDLPPAERAAHLRRCAPSDSVRADVEELLAADAGAETLFEQAAQQARESFLTEGAGMQLGAYRTLKLLGHGGMGAVYLAERIDGQVERNVAIKVMHKGLETPDLIGRFQAERRILARLSHPYIAAFYDAGTTSDGRLWFAMEYVDGAPIDQFAEARALSAEARVRLFLKVLEAVEYAHRNVVIHRDLKPLNILVGEDGSPKLLDFGIAKVLGSDESSGATRILTPDFAAPEQIQGEPVTTATDTYLAGGVLYKLLTGAPPHNLAGATPAEVQQIVCEGDVTPPRALNPSLPPDLENIVLMSLRREPPRRYASAAQFSDDLRRYLDGMPVSATPDSFAYRALRLVSRHRIPVAAAAFCVVSLIGGLIAAAHEASVARRHFQEVRSLASSFLFDFEKEIHDLPGATKARSMVIGTGRRYLDTLYTEAPGDPALMRELAGAYDKLAVLEGSTFASNTGEYDRANRDFRKAIDLSLRLGDGASADPKVRRNLVRLYTTFGITLLTSGRISEAKEVTTAAARNGEQIFRIAKNEDSAMAAYNGYRTHATILAESGDPDGSFDYFRRAIDVAKSWESVHPGGRANRIRLLGAYYNLADTQDLFGDSPASAASARESLELLRPLLAKPATPQLARLEMLAEGSYGRALAGMGPSYRAEADRHLLRAVELAREGARKDPENQLTRVDLALEESLWGTALSDRGDARAIPVLEATKKSIDGESAKAAGNASLVATLANVKTALSVSLLRVNPARALEEASGAVDLADSLLRKSGDDNVLLKVKMEGLLSQAACRRALSRPDEAALSLAAARELCTRLLRSGPADKRASALCARAGS